HEIHDEWELPPQFDLVNTPAAFVAPVQDHDHRRSIALRLDELQPIFGVVLCKSGAGLQHEQVEAALREKKLMGGVKDLLATEVPGPRSNLSSRTGKRQFPNGNGMGFRFILIWFFVGEP